MKTKYIGIPVSIEPCTIDVLSCAEFRVDIITDEKESMYHAWLYHKDCGVKDYMFGWPFVQTDGSTYSKEDFIDLVIANLETDIQYYIEDHYKG